MAEVYPSDDDLLDLLQDSDTGVEYIPTGTAPYYLHFRKLLYRLLLATKRANDFRLFHEGGLSYGVKPGKFWYGNTAIEYAGSTGNAMPDTCTREIYLDKDGNLNLQASGYWAAEHPYEPVVRLARVTAASGVITSIEDARVYHSMAMPQVERIAVEAHTANDQLRHDESGSVHTNLGATGAVTIFMPTFNLAGTRYTVSVQTAQELRIDPVSGTIIDDSGTTASKYKYCSTVGAFMTVVSDGNGNWIVTGKSGTWLEEI